MNPVLPDDLESKILASVPKKCLAKWQIACKQWHSLLKDLLIKRNLAQGGIEFVLLLNHSVYSTGINLQGIHNSVDPSMYFRGKLTNLTDSKDLEVFEIFYCNGLILCTMKGNKMLVVWNPCNSETRWIKPRVRYESSDIFALGYVDSKSSCNSYKILRYLSHYDRRRSGTVAEVYEFSSDSWRVLDVEAPDWEMASRGVSVMGNTFWFAEDERDSSDKFILGFDFTAERFGCLPLPYPCEETRTDDHDDTAVLSVFRDEQLSVLHQYLHIFELEMKIWVTRRIDLTNERVTWSEFLVVDLGGFMLRKLVDVVSFLLDEENKVAVCCSLDVDNGKRSSIFIVGENYISKSMIKGLKREHGHFSSTTFQARFAFRRIQPKAKEKEKTKRHEPEGIVKEIKVAPIPKAY